MNAVSRKNLTDARAVNAIETFENTLRHTWSSLEVDPRLTKDGVIVLFHDPTLERTSTGTGRVVDHTSDELRRLKLKDPDGKVTEYRIPTLDDALAWARGKTVLFLDQKDVDVLDRARAIQRRDARAWAVVMAYTLEDARRLHAFDPEILMQVFLADSDAIRRFEASGVPWSSIVGFVTHTEPRERDIFTRIAAKGDGRARHVAHDRPRVRDRRDRSSDHAVAVSGRDRLRRARGRGGPRDGGGRGARAAPRARPRQEALLQDGMSRSTGASEAQ